jgi:nucleoredoxin
MKPAVGLLLVVVLIGGAVFFLRWRNPEAFSRLQTDVVNLVVPAPASPPPAPTGPSPLLKRLTAPATRAAAHVADEESNVLNLPSDQPAAPPAMTAQPSPNPTPTPNVPPQTQTAALPNAVPVVQPDSPDNGNSESAAAAQAATAGTAAASASFPVWTPPATLPAQPNWTWTTSDGHIYKNVKVVKVDPQTVMILHEDGGASVAISRLPPDLQKLLNYDPTLAANWNVAKMVAGNLFVLKDGSQQPVDDAALRPINYFAIYYSAQWCPPCHLFTPQLVKFYNDFKASHPDFELIFISEDNDANSMLAYMKEMSMPWPAFNFDQLTHPHGTFKASGIESFVQSGIPYLVLLDATGKVLSDSTQNGQYVGPQPVVDDIKKMVQ